MMKYFLPLLLALFTLLAACEGESVCMESNWYEDADGDGLGNPDNSISACEQPDGFVSNSNDTDDAGSSSVQTYGDALADQIDAGDGNGIDNSFRISGLVIDESSQSYFAVNGVHPVNMGDYESYYPKSIVQASLATDEIIAAWSFDASTLGRQVDMEALCFAEDGDKLYIGDEYNYIYELDLTSGLVSREWNLADIGISTSADRGIEALTYYDGYFFAGIQEERRIYQLDLHLSATEENQADFQKVESLSSFEVASSPSGLFGGSDGSLYMVAFGGGNVNQNIYKYSTDGSLICTITIGDEVDIQQADGIYLDSNQEYVYIADSQGALNGLASVYRLNWSDLTCQ
ncbi:MAG: hypothetical protein R8P61_07185 [Bacteroidia bacterium]|nr:hypothetical protein [Bacteroidia bacterium]